MWVCLSIGINMLIFFLEEECFQELSGGCVSDTFLSSCCPSVFSAGNLTHMLLPWREKQ